MQSVVARFHQCQCNETANQAKCFKSASKAHDTVAKKAQCQVNFYLIYGHYIFIPFSMTFEFFHNFDWLKIAT